MPSSPKYKRDYEQERRTAERRGETGAGSRSGDAVRHRARRLMLKKGMVKKGQDVNHKEPLSKGGAGTKLSNLQAQSPSANRGFPRTRKGAVKG